MQSSYGLIAGVLSASAHLIYITAILRGTTRPERASWFLWSTLGTISFLGQLAAGATGSLWLVGVHTSFDTIIFFLSLKFGIGGFAPRDIIGLIAAGIGLYAWHITNNPIYALLFSAGIGSIGGILTILKISQKPRTESKTFFVLAALAGLFGALAVGKWSFALLIYPVYIFTTSLLILTAVVITGRRRTKRKTPRRRLVRA